MPDREKVIEGLEYCSKKACSFDCPYYLYDQCVSKLHKDLLKLLKEQEPVKPMTGGLCGQCGCRIYQDANYCYNCGRKVKRDE